MQLVTSPIAAYESTDPLQILFDGFEAAFKKSKASDVFTLQNLVRNALKNVQGGEEAVLIMSLEEMGSGTLFPSERPAVLVYSEGDVVCILRPFEQTFWCRTDAGPEPIKCQLWLTGKPTEQTHEHLNTHRQQSLMYEVLARRLAQTFDEREFLGPYEAANKIAEVCHDARSELAKHMTVHTTTVKVGHASFLGVPMQEKTAIEQGKHKQAETGEAFDSSPKAVDGSDLEHAILEGLTDTPIAGKDLERGFYSLDLSKERSEHDHAAALTDLLRELDGKLFSITSLHSEPQPAPIEAMYSIETASDTSITSKDLEPGFDSLTLSTETSGQDHAAALKDLLRDLDSKIPSFPSQMQRGVVIALGSNLGNRIEEIEKACRAIDADPDMRIVDTSFLYETKPMYVEDQGEFVNGACEVRTGFEL